MGQKLPLLSYPTSFRRPCWGDPIRISPRSLSSEN